MESTNFVAAPNAQQESSTVTIRILETATEELHLAHQQIESLKEQIEQQKAEISRIEIQLLEVGTRDTLTGLKNRTALVDRIEVEVERFRRTGIPCSALVFSIDKFDSIVDQYGKDEGVRCIQQTSRLLLQVARKVDFVARIEGSKFVILLPTTDDKGAALSAERHRSVFEKTTWPNAPVTISIGGATLNNHVETTYRFVHRADEALAIQQSAGGNGFTHFNEITDDSLLSLVA